MKTRCSSAAREWVLRNPGGQELVLRLEPGQSATVGRDLTSDLPILDAGVSRHHAVIALEKDPGGDALWVEDLHSHNGTFVNTERIQRTRVFPGDVITFGRIPLTLTERQAAEESIDPLERLSPEKLAVLVHVAREFSAEPERPMIFQRLLELAREVLQAERGSVLLWEEKRSTFHPVAASPPVLFQDVSRLITSRVGETILRGGKARLLWIETSKTGVKLDFVQSSFAPSPCAMATPILAGTIPMGILYLDRIATGRAFQTSDLDFLYCLAWVTNTALGTSCQLSDMREWNERLETMVSLRATALEHPSDAGESPRSTEKIARLLVGLEGFIGTVLEAKALGGTTASCLEQALQTIHLRTRALRCLCDRQSARLEEVQVGLALRDAAEARPGLAGCRVAEGGDLSVVCAPDEFFLALELAMDFLACGGPAGTALVRGTATPSQDGGVVHIRLSCPTAQSDVADNPPASEPTPQAPWRAQAAKEAKALALRLLKGLVRERLRGSLETAPEGSWLEIRLPQAAISFGETAAFPANNLNQDVLAAVRADSLQRLDPSAH